jgi:tripartite-type tricarboxylate transporter receptor subunit TctC
VIGTCIAKKQGMLKFIGCLVATLLIAVSPASAWPDRPVRLIVGFQAGGSTDVVARLLADRLRAQFNGASFIVENKPGANGMIAAEVMRNAHDGHTLLIAGDSYVLAPLLSASVKVHPLTDFKMISTICEGTVILLAAPNAPFKTFADMVAYARANPGKLNYVSSGIGNPQHLVGEYLAGELKLDMVHVPSRGGGQAVNDLVAGQIPMGILGLGPTLSHVKAGTLTPLAVTVDRRLPQLRDVPTLSELGVKNFVVAQWFGLVGPSDMPDDVAERLSKAVAGALDDAGVRKRYEEIGFMTGASTPGELRAKMQHDEGMWKKVVQERNIKID